MNKKKIFSLVILCIAMLGCIGVPVCHYLHYKDILTNGERVIFRITAYDPYAVFRGRYLSFRIQPDHASVTEKIKYNEPAYLILKKGADDRAEIITMTKNKPADGLYYKVKCLYSTSKDDNERYIEYPLSRYYLKETKAAKAEKLLSEKEQKCEIVLRIKDGSAVVESLLVNGIPVESLTLQ